MSLSNIKTFDKAFLVINIPVPIQHNLHEASTAQRNALERL